MRRLLLNPCVTTSAAVVVSSGGVPRPWKTLSGACLTCTATSSLSPHIVSRRFQQQSSGFAPTSSSAELGDADDGGAEDDLHTELASAFATEGHLSAEAAMSTALEKLDMNSAERRVRLVKLDHPPARFDILTNSFVYCWQTTADLARKVTGPMREWATELKYRTGVHMECEPLNPERLNLGVHEGGYADADAVDVNVYLFGSERGIFNCQKLMESIIDQDPCYVRLGVFRRIPGGAPGDVEWLLLRRINRELRPPDIPPISLKLPGKWTLLYEQYKEAAMRTLWEETGITVDGAHVFPTAKLVQTDPNYYWRVPVRYFVAEVPHDVAVMGPQVVPNTYMREWDSRLLRQSPDPIDRAWAQLADPATGCAWMRKEVIDELQKPLRRENYMAQRYTPPPYANLAAVLGFPEVPMDTTAPTQGTDGATTGSTQAVDETSAVEAEGDAGQTNSVDRAPKDSE